MKRSVILIVTVLLCVGCDQTTKYTARELLSQESVVSLMDDTIRLQYIENQGAFLSLGASLSAATRFWIFTVLVSFALAVMLFYSVRSKTLPRLPAIALSLLIGGGTSNLIDRIIYDGAVIDFLNVGIGGLRTGIFNMADVAIVAGAGLLLFSALFENGSNLTPASPGPE